MTLLAYFDVRPLLFLGGLPLFLGISLLVCKLAKAKFPKRRILLSSALLFTALFTLFLTGFGPFVDQEETREYLMSWEIKPDSSEGKREAAVILTFVDFPSHYIGEYSDELAAYLKENGKENVRVIFEVTSDYGKVRGFHGTEIAGLRDWRSERGYAGSSGSSEASPWD